MEPGRAVGLKQFINEHPGVNVDLYRDGDVRVGLPVRGAHAHNGKTALFFAIRHEGPYRCTDLPFCLLVCGADANHARELGRAQGGTPMMDHSALGSVTEPKVDACIEQYQNIQAYIDEYHRVLKNMLSEHVPVDPGFGLGMMGIYHEPLDRVLEYLGLSMSKDQHGNASIDDRGPQDQTRRSLLTGNVRAAKYWYRAWVAWEMEQE